MAFHRVCVDHGESDVCVTVGMAENAPCRINVPPKVLDNSLLTTVKPQLDLQCVGG